MKRCPKCNRTFPDDNQKFCTIDGGLLEADKPFDPNATIAIPPKPSTPASPPPTAKPASEPDFGATIATGPSAPTAVFPKNTGPTGIPTSANMEPPQRTVPPPPNVPPPSPGQSAATPRPPAIPQSRPLPQSETVLPVPVPPKKSKLPLVLGILAILLVVGAVLLVAAFFLIVKPRLDEMQARRSVVVSRADNENTNTNTSANTNSETAKTEETKTEATEFVAPPNTMRFANSSANLEGKLAEHYFDFSFYYPEGWQTDPKAGVPGASNFAKVERRLPPDFTQENFAVGWYTSKGTYAADEATFPQLVEVLGTSLARNFPGYRKVSEGPTKVNSLDGYEFRFESVSKDTEKGDIQVWGRVIFLPTGKAGDHTGATLVMLASSLAPELSGVEDVGEKGEMPVILESFRFGKGQ